MLTVTTKEKAAKYFADVVRHFCEAYANENTALMGYDKPNKIWLPKYGPKDFADIAFIVSKLGIDLTPRWTPLMKKAMVLFKSYIKRFTSPVKSPFRG